MSVMTALLTDLPSERPLSIEDLDAVPGDGRKYELDDGVLIVTSAPAFSHQYALTELTFILRAACPKAFLTAAGPGVVMNQYQYRIPDLVVIQAGMVSFTDKIVSRPPALAVEVASPSTAIYDRNRKKDVYADFGIESYWIVTPSLDKPRLVAFELRSGGRYHEVADVSGDESFEAVRPFPVSIVPAALVAGPWAR